jgi:hypothetical protein
VEVANKAKLEVKVGPYAPDGTFLGQVVRFTGEEVGSYTDFSEAQSSDDRGTTYTLYRCPIADSEEAGYRVHVEKWTRRQGEGSEAWLEPNDPDPTPFNEGEARNAHPQLFAALGMPNVVELD